MNKKRKKNSRHRGSHTHGRGAKKKARGSGHRGGIGLAGSGKRADQKKSKILSTIGKKYFGKDKIRRAGRKIEEKVVNLQHLAENIESYVEKGIATLNKGVYEIDIKDHKVIGGANLNIKLKINAKAASQGALEAIKKSGGELTLTKGSRKFGLKLSEDKKEVDAEIGEGEDKVGLKVSGDKDHIEASVSEGDRTGTISIEKEKSADGEEKYSVKVGGSFTKKKGKKKDANKIKPKKKGAEKKEGDQDKTEGKT